MRGTKNNKEYGNAGWTFDNVKPGVYEILVTWTASTSRTTVPYTIFDGDKQKAMIRVDQRNAPKDLMSRGTWWKSLGEFELSGGKLKVELTTQADSKTIVADAVAISPPKPIAGKIVDNEDDAFETELKGPRAGGAFRGAAIRYGGKGQAASSQVGLWKAGGLAPGSYRILATWPAGNRNSTEVVYRVVEGADELAKVTVDQTRPPQGKLFENIRWQDLGTVTVKGDTIEVRLVTGPKDDMTAVADAIWVVPAAAK
jgi:hypothetical protein